MNRNIFLILILLAGTIFSQDSGRYRFELEKKIVMPEDIHGIFITNNFEILCGANKKIYKIRKDGEISFFSSLVDTTSQTHIWSIKATGDGKFLIAADDRVIELDENGKSKILYQGKFDGEWGVCDVSPDKDGNILMLHGKSISLLDKKNRRTELLVDTTAKNFVGIEFSPRGNYFLITDVFSAKVHKYFYLDGKVFHDKTFENIFVPEYISFNKDDEAFISLPPRNKIVSIDKNGKVYFYLLGDEYRGINTIQIKKGADDKERIYIVLRNEVRIALLIKNE